jgi:hypothetical protein
MNRTSPLYVSYYTIGNGYEAEAAELERSLNAHRLPHRIEGVVPNGWTWARATQYKAEFLRRMQLEHPDRPIVWLDADARVVRRPLLFDCLDCHFAGHWYRQRELLSGTLYFAPGRTTQHLVEEWIESNRRHSGGRCADQRNLQELVSRGVRVDRRRQRQRPQLARLWAPASRHRAGAGQPAIEKCARGA